MIDTANYVENTQPLAASLSLTGPAQNRVTPNEVSIVDGPSPGGVSIRPIRCGMAAAGSW